MKISNLQYVLPNQLLQDYSKYTDSTNWDNTIPDDQH